MKPTTFFRVLKPKLEDAQAIMRFNVCIQDFGTDADEVFEQGQRVVLE